MAKGIGQLQLPRYVRANDDANANAVRQKGSAGALYSVEAHEPNQRSLASLTVAGVDVFRGKEYRHDMDRSHATSRVGDDLDLVAPAIIRRAL